MKNKYMSEDLKNNILKSTTIKKSVLFLFLGLLLSFSVKSQCPPIIDTAIVTNVCIPGAVTGSINFDMLPGGNYTYLWSATGGGDLGSNSQFGEDLTNLVPGTYSVTITDLITSTQCDTSFTISQPQDPLSMAATLSQDVNCFGDSTGVAYATAIGGVSTASYSYEWSFNSIVTQSTQLAVDLWAGIHTVTVTDANGCQAQASVDVVNLYPAIFGTPTILTSADYAPYDISCFGACDANVELLSGGGSPPYTYVWSSGQTYSIGFGPDTAFNFCDGGYNVLIEDILGCKHTVTFDITQPNELFVSAVGNGAVSNGISTQPVQCYGFDDGTAYATAVQGTPLYTYVWDSISGVNTGQYVDSLTPGIHTVYVTDANGCTAYDTVLITEPTQLIVDIIDSLVVYAYCSNTLSGELCAVVSGGIPAYSYVWNDVLAQTTLCASDLIADQYTITVMDDRNCIAQASFDLDSISNIFSSDSVVFIQDSISCFGLYDGALTVDSVLGGFGGVGPYTYNWNGPASYSGSGNNITVLQDGNYSVLITDVNGCAINAGTYLYQPDEVQFDIYNTIDETCDGVNNGQILIEVTGGTGSYYYDMNQLGVFPFLNFDTIYNDSMIINLSPGNYSIYVTDDNGCQGAVIGNNVALINGGISVELPFFGTPTGPSCFNTDDGMVPITNTNPLFTYTWELEDPLNPGEPSGVDISNGAGIYWDSFSASTTYFLVVHYADSASFGIPYSECDVSSPPILIPVAPNQILPNILYTSVSCNGGSDGEAELTPTGGTPPFVVAWDTTNAYPLGSSSLILNNLTVGTYAAIITDNNGCKVVVSATITEPLPLISDITPTHVSCYGFIDGAAQVQVVAGTGTSAYSYDWFDATTLLAIGQTTQTATGLSAGGYYCEVTDDNGCLSTDTVQILQPADPVASIEVESLYYGPYDVRCFGESNAAALATGSGVLFEWFYYDTISPNWAPIFTGQYTGQILDSGVYIVISKDANGCVDTSNTITITEPDSLIISVDESNPSLPSTYQISCFGADDGWAEVTINGGVESTNVFGYDINWVNNSGDQILGDTIADNLEGAIVGAPDITYTVTVEDANGCSATVTTVPFTQPIEFNANVTTVNYAGPFHGPLNISFIDSTLSDESYSFEWIWQDGSMESFNGVVQTDNQMFTHMFLETELGSNYVFVMLTNDVTGCQDSVEFYIEVQGIPDINNVFTPNSDGINDEFSFSEYAMESVDVTIYNRWGQLVDTWVGENKKWNGIGIDGNDVPEGVYFYVLVAKGEDGHYYDHKGTITLLR
jgi:gliding motility-associated-like protein